MNRRNDRGFTLVEMLTVMAIISILASMLLPSLSQAREKARRAYCGGNLKQIGLGLIMYAVDWEGRFPGELPNPTNNLEILRRSHIMPNGKIWACPSRTESMTESSNTAYLYIGSGLRDDHSFSDRISLAYDENGNHPGNRWMNVVFIDGHVKGYVPGTDPEANN